jgi:hypothetical protein
LVPNVGTGVAGAVECVWNAVFVSMPGPLDRRFLRRQYQEVALAAVMAGRNQFRISPFPLLDKST